jgi:NAD(P)-dependent dehydrogenase (short-subunit alcohol dehydrogenase family)
MRIFRLDGRTAVVTGGRGKLGRLWVQALLDAGAKVAAIDLTAGDRAGRPDAFLELAADVRDRPGLEAARDEIEARLGPVSILVNNAGIDQPPSTTASTWRLEDVPADTGRAILEVNLVGLFQAAQVFGAGMAARGGGAIVNIGSLYAGVSPDARLYDHLALDPPFLKPPMYGASKAAVVALTKYLATHWGSAGVRVNALSPGGILGAQDAEFRRKFAARVPLGRLGEEADLAGPLIFLVSDAARYITGIELMVDGGYSAW